MQHGGDDTAWRNAFGATAAISLIPNLILFAIPTKLLSKDSGSKINYQHILLCFASGALLGELLNCNVNKEKKENIFRTRAA